MTAKLFTTAAAAIALSATPTLAQESQFDRAPAPIDAQAEQIDDNGPGLLLAIAALAAIIAAILIAAGQEGEDEVLPTSP
ncbi:hypothetical protein [Erythrobacter sp. EC-HK427]|uniref:hypothetical protein n=1 Tax=Erythrobacter sp. EC-HK427 TaxID=2038396 RepID=UPI001258AB92|nr:hypothetical protein [Erythrobacter sp. EC-HK427]VVS97825.1 conserved exported hypothetical protein [Erythrobacter sp. EC-HK427]